MATVTTFLAAWGAILSTVAIVWNIHRDLTDRGRLRVICYRGRLVGSGIEDPRLRLVYNVTNTGRRPVVVTHVGGKLAKDQHFMLPTRNLPRTLQPGEYFLEYSEDLSVLEQKPMALWAIDSIGRHWQIPRRQLRKLLAKSQDANSCRTL